LKTLGELTEDANDTVKSGYYDKFPRVAEKDPSGTLFYRSLVNSIEKKSKTAIICEIKFASPSAGKIDDRHDEVSQIAKEMESGGASGLSVLTEPKNFSGSLVNLQTARASVSLPVIMKDIIVSEEQIKAANRLGANAVLLIWEVFSEGYSKLTLEGALQLAKRENLEVIVETHSKEGLINASKLNGCDIIGINNRDLKTFKTDIKTTVDLLSSVDSNLFKNRLLMSESGFENRSDIRYVLLKLEEAGAPLPRAFLIGTSIMKSKDVKSKVSEFVVGIAE
jgi:indole-3-glycerol phosphate synthase